MKNMEHASFSEQREAMVSAQIEARGIKNPLVLKAMRTVPRHEFIPEDMWSMAYDDRPLPIGQGQTISQPYIVAYMTERLRLTGGEKVLEIGTGCGYQAAVLGMIAAEVYSVECVPALASSAQENLKRLGFDNVFVKVGDGTLGWKEHGPYHGIIATASGPKVPEPCKEQLRDGGVLIMPVGDYRFGQSIVRITRGQGDRFHEERLLDVAFVPLIGKHGWEE